MKTIIYTLSDPITNEIRYVGKTSVDLNKRYNQHVYQWKRSNKLTHVNSWIKNLYTKNLKPVINILDTVYDNWMFWEMYWIEQCKAWGFNLCNHTKGGEGTTGYKMSKESILKRLDTLKTSKLWHERNARHAVIMKNKHKLKQLNFGYAHLSKEKRNEIGKKHSAKMKENYLKDKSCVENMKAVRRKAVAYIKDDIVVKTFNSVTEAAKEFNIHPTHVSRVCKLKSKHAYGLQFRYI
jgi:hypothetical protein